MNCLFQSVSWALTITRCLSQICDLQTPRGFTQCLFDATCQEPHMSSRHTLFGKVPLFQHKLVTCISTMTHSGCYSEEYVHEAGTSLTGTDVKRKEETRNYFLFQRHKANCCVKKKSVMMSPKMIIRSDKRLSSLQIWELIGVNAGLLCFIHTNMIPG